MLHNASFDGGVEGVKYGGNFGSARGFEVFREDSWGVN